MRVCASCARLLAGERCPDDGGNAIEVDRLEDGARIGPYTVRGLLGKGGMGQVYEAVHDELGRRVALKFLRDDIDDDELPERFLREARAVSRIDHDNVIRITDYGDGSGGAVYFVMEYLAGETLWDLNRRHRGGLDLAVVLDVYTQIMSALEAAHRAGVVHRDLKPTNVMIVERERTPHFVKLLDFGLARLVDKHHRPGLTIEGTIMGTPEYMSPEQVDGKPAGVESDVYSLGAMLYESVTGEVPFPAAGVSFLALARQILDEPPVPPGRRRVIPPALDELICRALSKDPEDRYPSVALMRAELAEALAGVEADRQFDAAQTEPSLVGIEPVRQPPPPPPTQAPRGRTPWPAIALVAILAVVVVATIGITMSAAGDESEAVDAAAPAADAAPATVAGLWAARDREAAVAMARSSLEREIAAGEGDAISGVIRAATPAIAGLLYAALEAGPQHRAGAAAAIAELKLYDGGRRIQEAMARSGPGLRVELAAALFSLNGGGKPVLVEALAGGDRNAALAAAEALSLADERDAIRALREVVASDPPGRARWTRAAIALARHGDERARRLLDGQLGGDDDRAAVAAAAVLALRDDAAASYLDRVVNDPQFSARREAALALARLGRPAALDFVEPGLAGSDLDKLAAIAVAARLAKRGGNDHAAAIAPLAGSANLEISAAARAALLAF